MPLCGFDDQVTGFGISGPDLYFLTHKDAAKFNIIARAFSDGKLGPAREVVPESDKVIHEIISAKDGIYYTASDGVDCRLYKIEETEAHPTVEIPLPYVGWSSLYALEEQSIGNLEMPGVLVNLTSWTRAEAYYRYDPDRGTMVALNLQPEGPYDHPSDLISEELKVKSHDDTLVPLSVLGLKSFKKDSSRPVWLQGYGAYGIVDEPFYSPSILAAFEHGLWRAVAHVRGGGVAGDAWHRAGMKSTETKYLERLYRMRRLPDSEWLFGQRQVSRSGGSAGGILIGRAVTERRICLQSPVRLSALWTCSAPS